MHLSLTLVFTSIFIILLNIPFGCWRASVRRFSLQWYLAIHIPVPLIILLRFILDIGWHWSSYVFFILAFTLGQLIGGRWLRCSMRASSSGKE